MAKLDSLINKIRTAVYGRDVRSSIADSIEAMNIENQETSDKVHCLGNIFNNLIIDAGNSNAEIVAARTKADGTNYSTIGERLNAMDADTTVKDMVNEVENKINSIRKNPEIYFMNGSNDEDATYIRTSTSKHILIDCGEETTADWLIDKLHKLGVYKLDYLFITHSHSDHIGGAVKIIKQLKPTKVYYKDITWTLPDIETTWQTMLYHNNMLNAIATTDEVEGVVLTKTTTVSITELEQFTFLNCESYSDKTDYNNDSLMIVYDFAGSKVLFQGDCYSHVAWDKYNSTIGHVQLLKMVHHGGIDNVNKGWITALRPTYTFYTHENLVNLNFYKSCVNSKLYTKDYVINYAAAFVVTSDGVIPTSTAVENTLGDKFIKYEGNWRYVDQCGNLVQNGIISNKGNLFIIKDFNCAMKSNTSSEWYYMNVNDPNSDSYVLNSDGSIKRNEWIKSTGSGNWYYLGPNGKYLRNCTYYIGFVKVTFNANGIPNNHPSA